MILDLLDALRPGFGVHVHGDALLPDHAPLRVQTPRASLSRAMQHLGGPFTPGQHRLRRGGDGPVFRGRVLNRLGEDEADRMHLLADLRCNPVRGHLVHDADEPAEEAPALVAVVMGRPPTSSGR